MSSVRMGLTTTSYAILGLLCVDEWSAYDLAQQMGRSFRFIWPRAESAIYLEPKKLVAAGYASQRQVPAGPSRTKPAYRATPAGRRAFRVWLAQPSAPPHLEAEGLVRFMFVDQGGVEDAQRILDELAKQAAQLQRQLVAVAQSYDAATVPFPQRAHINATAGRLLHMYADLLGTWASWARAEVDQWPDTGAAAAHRATAIIQDSLRHHPAAQPAGTGGPAPIARPRSAADNASPRRGRRHQ